MSNLRAKLKYKTECRDITDLVGLTGVFAAQNRAKGSLTARICADADRKKKGVWDSRGGAVP